jgi:hypothetical protein
MSLPEVKFVPSDPPKTDLEWIEKEYGRSAAAFKTRDPECKLPQGGAALAACIFYTSERPTALEAITLAIARLETDLQALSAAKRWLEGLTKAQAVEVLSE